MYCTGHEFPPHNATRGARDTLTNRPLRRAACLGRLSSALPTPAREDAASYHSLFQPPVCCLGVKRGDRGC